MATSRSLFVLWLAMVIGTGQGCPELCSCSDKYGRQFAECSYKHLTEVPDRLPTNVTILSLSANRITMITLGCFENVTQVTSLWMANNAIVSIEEGSLTPLVNLRNFDISYNQIVDFPWEDLQNLTSLQLLKMNHNEMVSLPRDAFSNLKDLRSLRLNNNQFITIAQGTFDGLISLSHLQLYDNPFACICSMDWLRDWILKTTISVPEQNFITCASPPRLKGEMIVKLPESKCMSPNVTIISEPNIHNTTLHEDTVLILTCEFKGNPKPAVIWKIHSQSQKRELALFSEEDDSAESAEALLDNDQFQVFSNGTLVILHLSKKDGGNYSCSATNEFGKAEESVSLQVMALPQPTPVKTVTVVAILTKILPSIQSVAKTSIFQTFHLPNLERKGIVNVVPSFQPVLPSVQQPAAKTSIFYSFHLPNLENKDINIDPSFPPVTEIDTEHYKQAPTRPPHASKCGLTPNTQYISNHAFNGSLDDVKQYTFDFGVIALGVSETEARVRINPLLIPKVKASSHHATSEGLQTNDPEPDESSEESQKLDASLYLCITADHKHSAVQWSRIEDGLNTYLFQGLRPGTNYSLCLTYRGHDCEVRVLFATRRRVPNLLIIISVSICLLSVSTVPLLGATCFHLVYKYRTKTYKLIMKAKDQYHVERKLTTRFHTPYTESQRNINGSELEEGEAESESRDGGKEDDMEGSVVTESFTLSQYRGNMDDCEEGSEYSDRLPLGAEAVNITSNYKYPIH